MTNQTVVEQRRSLHQNVPWALVGHAAFSGARWGLLILVAQLSGMEALGMLGLAIAITAPVAMLTYLDLRTIQITDVFGTYSDDDYMRLRLVTSCVFVLLVAAAGVLLGYRLESLIVILGWGLVRAIEGLGDVLHGVLQRHERMDRVAQLQLVSGCTSLAAMASTLWAGAPLWAAIVAVAGGRGIVLLLADLPAASRLWSKSPQGPRAVARAGLPTSPRKSSVIPRSLLRGPTMPRMTSLTLVALPLGLATTMTALRESLPRLIVEHQLGERALGAFVAVTYLLVLGGAVANAVAQAFVPRLARLYAHNRPHEFLQRLAQGTLLCGAAGLVVGLQLIAFGAPLMRFLYGPEYGRASALVFWLGLALVPRLAAGFLAAGLGAMRAYRVKLLAGVLSVVMMAGLSGMLIGPFGLRGAAWALFLSAICDLTIASVFVGWVWRRRNAERVSVRLTPYATPDKQSLLQQGAFE